MTRAPIPIIVRIALAYVAVGVIVLMQGVLLVRAIMYLVGEAD